MLVGKLGSAESGVHSYVQYIAAAMSSYQCYMIVR